MKQYGVFHPLFLSFFSKSLYRDVAKNWKGVGYLFMAVKANSDTESARTS